MNLHSNGKVSKSCGLELCPLPPASAPATSVSAQQVSMAKRKLEDEKKTIIISSDHAAVSLRTELISHLQDKGYEVLAPT